MVVLLFKLFAEHFFEFFQLGLYNVGAVWRIAIQVKIILVVVFSRVKIPCLAYFGYNGAIKCPGSIQFLLVGAGQFLLLSRMVEYDRTVLGSHIGTLPV